MRRHALARIRLSRRTLGALGGLAFAAPAALSPGVAVAQTAAPATLAPAAPAPSTASYVPAPAAPKRVVTLAEAERAALEQQPQMRVARAATDIAEGEANQARAPLLPQVTGTASYTRETGNYALRPGVAGFGAGGSVFSNSYDLWSFGLTGTQLIYDFGQTSEKYHAADLNVDAQRYSEQATRLTVVLNVRTAYFNARAMKELVAVAQETLDDQNKHLAQVQGQVTVGTQPPIALAQQKAACANAVVQLIQADNNYETSKAQLNQAAGIFGGTEYDVGDEQLPAPEDEDQPLEALAAKAIAARPEIATFQKQRESQEATLSSVKGGYGPTLSGSAGINDIGENLTAAQAVGGLVPNWSAGLLLNWPLYQGGLTKGQIRQAEAGLDSIDAQRAVEVLAVRLQVDTARLSVRAAKATIGASQDALDSSRDQLRLAEQRFSTGVGNIIELNDAQVAYTTAAAQVVQARFALASARAQLLAALGRT
jgi:outer membrane protein